MLFAASPLGFPARQQEQEQSKRERQQHQGLGKAALLLLRTRADRLYIDHPAVGINGEDNLILNAN
jgi:hypothetical protein